MNEENPNKIENEVLKKIQQGDVRMTSRKYFAVKTVLTILVGIAIFTVSTMLVSFLIFSLSNRGDLFLLSFGTKGIYKFILIFPWYLLSVAVLLLVILDYLLRRFRFGYHSPLVYLFMGTLVFVTGFSFIINITSFHVMLEKFAERNNLPFVKSMYGDVRKPQRGAGVFRGVVSFIGEDYLLIKPSFSGMNSNNEEIIVRAPEGIDLSSFIKIGEEIYIAGDVATGTEIISYGMHRMVSTSGMK